MIGHLIISTRILINMIRICSFVHFQPEIFSSVGNIHDFNVLILYLNILIYIWFNIDLSIKQRKKHIFIYNIIIL